MQVRDIPGWPGYRISEIGVVESCRTNGGKLGSTWRVLAQSETRDGYKQVHLLNNGISKLRRVHSLVLMAFIGRPPDGTQCCHNDGNKKNNSITNLRWDTVQSNIKERDANGSTSQGERNGNAKLDCDGVSRLIEHRRQGMSYGKVAAITGMSKRQVMRICKGESWRYISSVQKQDVAIQREKESESGSNQT